MNLRLPGNLVLLLVVTAFVALPARAQEKTLKLEALLIWGTNEENSPNPRHKPVSADLEKKLKEQPFKWAHYFEVERKSISVPVNGSQRFPLSKECALVVNHLGGDQIEVTLVGKGEKVVKVKNKLPPGETLVLGGNAANATSWLVVLRQVK